MADKETNPIRQTDDAARTLARGLIADARFGALGVIDPETGAPMVTRVAVGTQADGQPVTLISDLSQHTRALKARAECSLLVGEPAAKGDPLTHPRLTLQCTAAFLRQGDDGYDALRARYLQEHPKSKLYIDFADFSFAVLGIDKAFLNGGFGKAFVLTTEDLSPAP